MSAPATCRRVVDCVVIVVSCRGGDNVAQLQGDAGSAGGVVFSALLGGTICLQPLQPQQPKLVVGFMIHGP